MWKVSTEKNFGKIQKKKEKESKFFPDKKRRPKGAKRRVFSKIANRESVDFAHIAHESSFLRFQHPST